MTKIGIIAGSSVKNGKVVRNSMLRVIREDELIHEGILTSLKRFKDDAQEVKEGYECGIGVQGLADVYMKLGFPFDSEEASLINKEIQSLTR